MKSNCLCNELGMDPISLGAAIACAMELYENGHLPQDVAGYDLYFGNAKAMVELTRKTAYREGFGDQLAEGSYRLAGKYGHPELSMSIKKQEVPAYDPLGILAAAVDSAGLCLFTTYGIGADEIAAQLRTATVSIILSKRY